MLEPNYLFNISNKVVDLYSELENSIIRDIVRRIVNAGTMTQSTRHQTEMLQQAGMLYEDIVKKVSNMTNISEDIVNKLFKEAGTRTLEYDDYIYRKAGLNPLPINQSESMLNILKINTKITNKSLDNLALSTALTGKNKFIELSDMAILQTETGAFGYNTAIWNAIKNVTDSGIYVQYPSGRKDKIDVAIRRNVMTAISQTAGNLQEQRANEMNCDLVEVSAHVGARPAHELWQGKIFSRSGNSKKYPDFVEVTGYGTATGLCGINCRHSFYPYFEGLSEPSYTQEELDEINNKTVKYNGKEIKEYEALQIQRGMERSIRQNKREISACEGILTSNANEELKNEANSRISILSKNLREKQSKLKYFTEKTGLVRQYTRERVPSYNMHIDKTVDNINRVENKKINGIIRANNENIDDKLNSKITLVEKISDLSDENKVNTLRKYEEKIVNKNVENAVVIGKNGDTYLVESKSSNSVYIKDLGEEILKDSYMTHNHPEKETYFSFSSYDISEFMETDMKKLRGIDYKYIYEIEKTKDTIKVNRDIILNEFGDTVEKEAFSIIFEKGYNADEELYHIENQILSKKYKYKYRRIKR